MLHIRLAVLCVGVLKQGVPFPVERALGSHRTPAHSPACPAAGRYSVTQHSSESWECFGMAAHTGNRALLGQTKGNWSKVCILWARPDPWCSSAPQMRGALHVKSCRFHVSSWKLRWWKFWQNLSCIKCFMQPSFSESELHTEPGVRNDLLKKPQQWSVEATKLPEELLPSLMSSMHTAPSTHSNLLLVVSMESKCFKCLYDFCQCCLVLTWQCHFHLSERQLIPGKLLLKFVRSLSDKICKPLPNPRSTVCSGTALETREQHLE